MFVSNTFTHQIHQRQLYVLKLSGLFRPFITVSYRDSQIQTFGNRLRKRLLIVPQRYEESICKSNVCHNISFRKLSYRLHKNRASFTSSSRMTKDGSKSSLPKEIKKAQDILNGLKERQTKRNRYKNSNITVFQINTAIIELSKIIGNQHGQLQGYNNIQVAQLAQAILDQMEIFYHNIIAEIKSNRKGSFNEKNILLCPNIITYNAVLNCWAKSKGRQESAINAESLLKRMISHYELNYKTQIPSLPIIKPDIISFHTTMDAWANSGDQDAGRKTEELLNYMKQMSNQHAENVMLEPTSQTYARVLHSWANSSQFANDNKAAEHATHILMEMINELRKHGFNERNDSNNFETNLSIAAFNSVIKAWARSGKGVKAAIEAQRIMDEMEKFSMEYISSDSKHTISLTTVGYNHLLDAWAKSGHKNSTKYVDKILERMHELFNAGYNTKPNTYSYTIAINTLARSKEPMSAHRAQQILEKMLTHCNDKDNHDMMPTTATFNVVIDAWCRSGDAECGKKAEAVLERLIKLGSTRNELSWHGPNIQPNTITFNSTITAWARSGDTRAGEMAEHLITRMEQYEGVQPDTVTYNALIDAHGQSRDMTGVTLAESVINRMEEKNQHEKSELSEVRPNTVTYNSLINVYANSKVYGKARKAEDYFFRMLEKGIEPDIVTYSCLLKTCSQIWNKDHKEIEDSLAIALDVYDHLRESKTVAPNEIIYSSMIDVCNNLLLKKREKDSFLRDIFYQCCQDGFLSNRLLKKMRRNVSPNVFHQMIGNEFKNKHSVHDLPSSWSRKINAKNSRQK